MASDCPAKRLGLVWCRDNFYDCESDVEVSNSIGKIQEVTYEFVASHDKVLVDLFENINDTCFYTRFYDIELNYLGESRSSMVILYLLN